MWEERLYTDAIIIKRGGAEYCIHSAVLSHISPVFRKKAETGTGRNIEIDIFSNEAVEARLRFVYTGTLRDQDALEVLSMAHMYQMEPLVIRCCELLVRNLNEQNIFATITAMQKVHG